MFTRNSNVIIMCETKSMTLVIIIKHLIMYQTLKYTNWPWTLWTEYDNLWTFLELMKLMIWIIPRILLFVELLLFTHIHIHIFIFAEKVCKQANLQNSNCNIFKVTSAQFITQAWIGKFNWLEINQIILLHMNII